MAAERQGTVHRRAGGLAPLWTAGPILARHKFTNVCRAADRVSQYLISNVIYTGRPELDELVIRILLFKIFNRIETWELLARERGEQPAWAGYSFCACEQLLGAAMRRGERASKLGSVIELFQSL